MPEGKTIIKVPSKEVGEAWGKILEAGLPIYVPVEHEGYTVANVPSLDYLILYPIFI